MMCLNPIINQLLRQNRFESQDDVCWQKHILALVLWDNRSKNISVYFFFNVSEKEIMHDF